MILLKKIVDGYMRKVHGIEEHCDRCLRTERWGGSVVLMVVDAAFTSIGLNYFTAVVPNVPHNMSEKGIALYNSNTQIFVYTVKKYCI